VIVCVVMFDFKVLVFDEFMVWKVVEMNDSRLVVFSRLVCMCDFWFVWCRSVACSSVFRLSE